MTDSRRKIDFDHQSATASMSDAIARALDGVPPDSDDRAVRSYHNATAPVCATLRRQHRRLQALGAAGLVAAPEGSEIAGRLLRALHVDSRSPVSIPGGAHWPGVIFIGCMRHFDSGHDHWLDGMLRRGAIVVSSDRSAGLPSIGGRLALESGRPGRRARFAAGRDLDDMLDGESAWHRYVAGMHPAVWLRAGHLPLHHEQADDVRVIARDKLTDHPLIVQFPALDGHVIHAVPHWWQETEPDTTEFGRRSLDSVPGFAGADEIRPDVNIGWFGAASVMMVSLLAALDVTLDEVARTMSANGMPPHVDLD